MSSAPQLHLLSEDQYLQAEEHGSVKHEYLGGVVYAMSGANRRHNRIATNILLALGRRLHGGPCEVLNSDMKVRVPLRGHVRFYYPDAVVVCGPPGDGRELFLENPRLVFEVLSRSTRRADQAEKQEAYLSLPSLAAYLMVEQDLPAVVVQRGERREVYEGLDSVVPLPEIGCDLPLSEVYARVDFSEPGEPPQED